MTAFYSLLIEKSGFDASTVANAERFEKKVDLSLFSHLFFDTGTYTLEKSGVLYFKDSFYPYEFYEQIKKLGIPYEKASLYLYILLSRNAFGLHKDRGLCENIFFDTLKTIADQAKEYRIIKHTDGLFNYHFLANHIRGSILRLGEFEYQYGEYNNKKAIFLHVPKDANLSEEKRHLSYSLARRYFGDYPIVGDSWLLYPENKKMLPINSKISEFMDDFNIVSTNETYDYKELFHIFGRLSDFSYENLPKNTSLQIAYAERVKKGLPVGAGVGVLKI